MRICCGFRTKLASMYTLRLPIKPHLKKFLITEYGQDPIQIDRESPIGIMLHAFLCKQYVVHHNYDIPKDEITMLIPRKVYEMAGHSIKPYQVNMLNNFIDGMFRDILFAGVTMTQATFPAYRESHMRRISPRGPQDAKRYRQKYQRILMKPQIKDVMMEALQYYGITEDDLKMETILKDYQRTMKRKAERKPSGKTFHPPTNFRPHQASAQTRTLF